MATLKITKKHHKHFNNPFTSAPKSGPFVHGKLFLNSQTLPPHQIYTIGNDFLLNWTSKDGGFISVSHKAQPTRHIWSTVPGKAFVSAAVAETEVEESRGSFLIKDRDIHLVCNHQTIEFIKVLRDESDFSFDVHDQDSASFHHAEQNSARSPALMIAGKLITVKKRKKKTQIPGNNSKSDLVPETSAFTSYWVLFDQKNSNQIGFQVRLGKPNVKIHQRVSPRIYQGFVKKSSGIRRRRVAWSGFSWRRKVYVTVPSSEEENMVMKAARLTDFNRIWLTYRSEKSERFFGFGEQFSHMDFKGKKVPIFVQEQGIGRGDQPITFAANLVSYRAGGDWSTTYAPSPFYMTSKMRSLYLEGYNYSIFDLTKQDRVQIQIYGDSVEGRILHGNSPSEFIEHFTETIGRPPVLPEWIISGAVVGMQGGTDTVRSMWNELQAYDVPISAFWLQEGSKEYRTE